MPIYFRQWSNAKFASFATLNRVVHIAVLIVSSSLLVAQPVLTENRSDSTITIYELEEVEAYGANSTEMGNPSLQQIMVLQREQLDLTSSGSFIEQLDFIPGVDVRTRGPGGVQSDISIRGGTFDQSMVLLNGFDLSNPQTGHLHAELPVPAIAIERLELLRGAGSKQFGTTAYSGALNAVTQPSDSLKVTLEGSYGSYNSSSYAAALHLPLWKLKTLIAGSGSSSDGYTANTDSQLGTLYLHAAIREKLLDGDFILAKSNRAFGANGFYTPRFPFQYEETGGWFMGLRSALKLNQLTLRGQLHWRTHSDHFELDRSDPDFYMNDHLTDLFSVAAAANYSSRAGMSTLRYTLRFDQIYSSVLGLPATIDIASRKRFTNAFSKYDSRLLHSLLLDHHYQSGRIDLQVSLMLYAGEVVSSPQFLPGMDLSLQLSDHLRWFNSWSRTMRFPTYTDLYYSGPQNLGNPDLQPEYATTVETGLDYRNHGIGLEAIAYFRNGRNSIDWIWADSLWSTQNYTELDTYGTEWNLTYIPTKKSAGRNWLHVVRMGYGFGQVSKVNDTVQSNYALDHLKHKAVLQTALNVSKNIRFTGTLRYQERAGTFLFYSEPTAIPEERGYTPFTLLDARLSWHSNQLMVYLDGTNLLNTSYRDIGSVPMPGRWWNLGFRFRY